MDLICVWKKYRYLMFSKRLKKRIGYGDKLVVYIVCYIGIMI